MISLLPLLVSLLLLGGDIPDPDRNAHDMWAKQLITTGRLVISRDGVFDDWREFYPNTVPKPLELLIGLIRYPGNTLYHATVTLFVAGLVLVAVWHSAGRGVTGLHSALFLGFNPAFIFLSLRGNPAIPFLGALFLLQAQKGATTGALIASLARPESFIYGIYHSVTQKKWKLLGFLGLIGVFWLIFHQTTCGSLTWAADEVKFSVKTLNYPTVNPVSYFPWIALRLILVLGAPTVAILAVSFKKWSLRVPFAVNILLLEVSLFLGSLVLPRYVDQLFLIATPFVFVQLHRLFKGRALASMVLALVLFPSFQWFYVLPEIQQYREIRTIYNSFELPDTGIAAANELLVPGFCMSLGIVDPRDRFVSIDKAAWSNASGNALRESNVTCLVVVPLGAYFPEHTKSWTDTIEGIEVRNLHQSN